MSKILIDLLGTMLEIATAMLFYEKFLGCMRFKRHIQICGVLFVVVADVILTMFLQNTILLPVVSIVQMLILSFCYDSSLTFRMLFSCLITAVLFATEQLFGSIFIYVLKIPLMQVKNSQLLYLAGVLFSKLLAMFIVYIARALFKSNKQSADRQLNLLMAFMPIQSIILCFIVYGYSAEINALRTPALGIAAVVISLVLVFIVMLILNNQHKALAYKKEYELAKLRLEMQIDHYQEISQAHHEVRSIRHNISNNLIAISGLLSEGSVQDAVDRINGINADVKRTEDIVDTGFPSIDAVINAKIAKASESDINYSTHGIN